MSWYFSSHEVIHSSMIHKKRYKRTVWLKKFSQNCTSCTVQLLQWIVTRLIDVQHYYCHYIHSLTLKSFQIYCRTLYGLIAQRIAISSDTVKEMLFYSSIYTWMQLLIRVVPMPDAPFSRVICGVQPNLYIWKTLVLKRICYNLMMLTALMKMKIVLAGLPSVSVKGMRFTWSVLLIIMGHVGRVAMLANIDS